MDRIQTQLRGPRAHQLKMQHNQEGHRVEYFYLSISIYLRSRGTNRLESLFDWEWLSQAPPDRPLLLSRTQDGTVNPLQGDEVEEDAQTSGGQPSTRKGSKKALKL